MPDAADRFRKAGIRLFCIDTSMPHLYTLPHVTENLFAFIIAGEPWWLVQSAGEFCTALIDDTRKPYILSENHTSSHFKRRGGDAFPVVPDRARDNDRFYRVRKRHGWGI